jgi:L-ascorbate metabolism protein UlaG (beta-lactamase superfamily)
MKITWYGHAAFLLETDDVRVILDPYNYPDCGGYLPIDESADVVCVSHENRRYHSDTSAIRGDFELVEAMSFVGGSREASGVRFDAIEVWENAEREGPNGMVKLELDGIVIAHQGDLGHALEGEQLDFLRGVDVLLALAGGPPTIQLDALRQVIDSTHPRLVLPMHYKTPKVNLNLVPIEDFLAHCDGLAVERPGSAELIVTRKSLPETTTVVVLEHAR